MISVSCNLCGRDDWELRFPATIPAGKNLNVEAFRCTNPGYGSHPQIVQCRHCDFVYANPRWEPAELVGAYAAVEDKTYLEERVGRELTFRKHLQAFEKRTGPANGRYLLDVGAYIGVFVEAARASGWEAVGVEPSRWAAGVAQEHGLPVIEGTQDAPELQGRQFDAITMWDVIEHLDDPAGELAKSYALLKPGGFMAVHTMDIDSLAARVMGRRWPWLMDMHIHYFSNRTLAQMLEQVGFEVLWVGPQSRFLSLGYLATRVGGLSRPFGRFLGAMFRTLRVDSAAVPVNFGDLITAYARRPSE
ncbi:MAG: class I SAM-dependent methyltransferase [Candidatus Promineifilaceae bacterium]